MSPPKGCVLLCYGVVAADCAEHDIIYRFTLFVGGNDKEGSDRGERQDVGDHAGVHEGNVTR